MHQRSDAAASTGEVSLADGVSKSDRIGAHAHDSILEASASLEGGAVFEGPLRLHRFAILQRQELNHGTESARRHLAEVGQDAGCHPGGACALTSFHVFVHTSTMNA